MTHAPIRKASVAILIFVFLSTLLSAAEQKPPSWRITPSIGVLWGQADEIVYDTSGVPNQNDYLSLLSWELNPVFMAGLDARWESRRTGVLDLSFRSAIPGSPSGEMNDYDWLYTDRDWSHWSVSDIWLRWGFILDAGYQWSIPRSRGLTTRFGVAYHLDWWAWRDKTKDSLYSTTTGGSYPTAFGTYTADDFRDRWGAVDVGVNSINYDVAYHSILAVISMEWVGRSLFMGVTGRLGPTLAFSHDHHKLRTENGNIDGIHFYDFAFGGPWFDASLELGFLTQGRFSFRLRGEYAVLAESRGHSIYVYTNGSPRETAKDAAGFSFRRGGVSLLFSWNLSEAGV